MSDAHRDEIAKLENLYAEHPEGRIFTHLAEAYRKAGELEQAHQVLSDGLERHPDYSSAYVVLGRVYMDQDRTEEAEAEFHRVLELDAHNLIAIRALGDLARARDDHGRALEFYHRLLDQEPSDDEVRGIVEELTAGPAEDAGAVYAGDLSGTTSGDAMATGVASDREPGSDLDPEASATDDLETGDVETGDLETGDLETGDLETGEPYQASDSGDEVSLPPEPSRIAEVPADEWSEEDPWLPDEASSEDAASEGGSMEEAPWSDEEPASGGAPWSEDAAASGGEESEEPASPEYPESPEPEPWSEAPAADEASSSEPWSEASVPVEEDSEEESPSPDAEDGVAAAERRGAEDTELRTETIAQVYARQGLYDRAAEVYRELVRARPEDRALRERLAEMDELAAAQLASSGEVDAVTDVGGEESDPWAAVEAPGEYGSEAEAEPIEGREDRAAEPEAESEEAASSPVEGFEATEVESAGPAPSALEGLTPEESDPRTGLRTGATPDTATPEEGLSEELGVSDVPAPPEELPWEASDDIEEEEPDVESVASLWTGADWDGDTEEAATPHAWTEPEDDDEDGSPPIRDYFSGLLDWPAAADQEDAAPGEAPADAAPAPGGDVGTGEGAGTGEAESGEPKGAGGRRPRGSEDDDDDLEMFRSWLESLKQ